MMTELGWESWRVHYRRDARRWVVRYPGSDGRSHDHRAPAAVRSRKAAVVYAHAVLATVMCGDDFRPGKLPHYQYELWRPPHVPDEWPEFGEYEGKRVRLRELVLRVPRHRLPETIIDVPGIGRCRPWKGLWQPGDTM